MNELTISKISKQLIKGIIYSTLCITSVVYAASSVITQWVELGPNNVIIARAITHSAQCPAIKLDSQNNSMQIMHTSTPDFPVTVCQKIIPSNIHSASILGKNLPLPPISPTKIVIVGDSGCRINKSGRAQNCNNPSRWPFGIVAKHAAAWKPDLVIHVGDYLYREYPCTANNPKCAGSPSGDNWSTWQADFFNPANSLLKNSPWIFARGNHESCQRAGNGWTRLLSPLNLTNCTDYEPLYSIDLGDTRLFILDTANADDVFAPIHEVSIYTDNLKTIANSSAAHNWIITHKPFWFVRTNNNLDHIMQSMLPNAQQTAWNIIHPAYVDLLISGHVHVFQTVNYDDERPPQIIVGASGATLNSGLIHIHQLKGYNSGGVNISSGISIYTFGYMTLEKQNNQWIAQMRTPYGKVLANCVLKQKLLYCQKTSVTKYDSTKKAMH